MPRLTYLKPLHRCAAFTLAEMIIVTAIVAITAGAAIPTVAVAQKVGLDSSAKQIARALQFAHQQAWVSRGLYTVKFNAATNMVEVYHVNTDFVPAIETLAIHPLEKTPYRVELAALPLTGAKISINASFTFADGTSDTVISFDSRGAPVKRLTDNSLSPMTVPGLWRGHWQAGGVSYAKDDWVVHDGVDYNSLQGHNSGSDFKSDIATGRWAARTQPAQVTVVARSHKQDIHVIPATGFTRVSLQ